MSLCRGLLRLRGPGTLNPVPFVNLEFPGPVWLQDLSARGCSRPTEQEGHAGHGQGSGDVVPHIFHLLSREREAEAANSFVTLHSPVVPDAGPHTSVVNRPRRLVGWEHFVRVTPAPPAWLDGRALRGPLPLPDQIFPGVLIGRHHLVLDRPPQLQLYFTPVT